MKNCILPLFLLLPLAPSLSKADPAERPNVLIIMADDCTFSDLPLYGGPNAKTPNIDRLAAAGLTFDHAYLAEAMCQPCRAELYTGQFPLRNGCAWNHSASHPDTKSIPHHLSALGYTVGIAGKIHVKPAAAFPFANIAGFDPSCVRDPTEPHDVAPLQKLMAAHTGDDRFCAVVALVDPHVPWVMGDASKYPPAKIKLPANIADTKMTRDSFSRYLAEVTYMDGQVGEILAALEKSGHADDTLVLFTSEQGSQFPGNKWTNWDTGVHTALIARWPEKIAAGKRTTAIVQYADVLPTLVNLAGGKADPASEFDGTTFLPVLLGQTDTHRAFAFGIHNNLPEGPPYPVRTITDGTFRYIRNLTPDELYIEKHVMGVNERGRLDRTYWGTWIWDSETKPDVYALVKRYQLRPAEQLYNTATDPYELHNLAADPAHEKTKARLAAELAQWMESQGDPGIPQDTPQALQAARKGKHLYRPTGK